MELFPETKWTILAEATLNGDESGKTSLGLICLKYKNPIDKIIKLKGVSEDRIEDVRQDFLLHLIKGSFFKKASQAHGKFRSFLLNALQNFLVDDFRKLSAGKRGRDKQHLEIDENLVGSSTDDIEFDLVWAETLFNNSLKHIENLVLEKRGENSWKALEPFFSTNPEEQNYDQLATDLNLSNGGAKAEVSRLRKKFRDQLRAEVSLTVDAPHEIDEELRYLKNVMIRVWDLKNG